MQCKNVLATVGSSDYSISVNGKANTFHTNLLRRDVTRNTMSSEARLGDCSVSSVSLAVVEDDEEGSRCDDCVNEALLELGDRGSKEIVKGLVLGGRGSKETGLDLGGRGSKETVKGLELGGRGSKEAVKGLELCGRGSKETVNGLEIGGGLFYEAAARIARGGRLFALYIQRLPYCDDSGG
ncbi:Zinc finger protein 423-like [Plakobranchus ocellatus]|uniref:Zinc finger protein 423-like n=1 Tax=Plakobranchus ocellatus TaxID=259542 RepID=A0AAV4AH64_9GAST|nr:Zinc finger protein 423-like [Plakobranchus ocellatus]